MKIVVLGATGMLGHVVANHMASAYGEESVIRTARLPIHQMEVLRKENEHWIQFDASNPSPSKFYSIPENTVYVINCIGIIKPFIEATGIVNTLQVNSIFPHQLAQYCAARRIKLIHITTDCVFSGLDGEGCYTEEDPHDVTDIYGRSKSLGEPIKDAMVLRTSIIGREIHKQASLVAWVQSQAGKSVNGFVNHFWNGITTLTYAQCCQKIIDNGWFRKGLYHIFSPSEVSKRELVQMISDALCLNVTVNPVNADIDCDRTLSSNEDLWERLEIPELIEQMKGL